MCDVRGYRKYMCDLCKTGGHAAQETSAVLVVAMVERQTDSVPWAAFDHPSSQRQSILFYLQMENVHHR